MNKILSKSTDNGEKNPTLFSLFLCSSLSLKFAAFFYRHVLLNHAFAKC